MDNIKGNPVVPVSITATDEVKVIDYPIKTIECINTGGVDGAYTILTGDPEAIVAGLGFEFSAGPDGYYPANTFSIDATGTIMKIKINK